MPRKYNTTGGSVYTQSGMINLVQRCNGFTFTNIGDTAATVNGMVIFPGTPGTILGDSRSIGGNEGEEYIGVIKLQFLQPVGAAPQVEIVQKYYID